MSFAAGFAFSSLILWAIFIRTPSLSDLKAQGSYALGLQVGRNLKKQQIEFDPRVMKAALEDAEKDQAQLQQKELSEGMDYIQKASAEKRNLNPAPPSQPPPAETSLNAPTRQENSASRQENQAPSRFDPERNPNNRNESFIFHVIARNEKGVEIFNSEKLGRPFILQKRDLSLPLVKTLQELRPGQKTKVQLNPEDLYRGPLRQILDSSKKQEARRITYEVERLDPREAQRSRPPPRRVDQK